MAGPKVVEKDGKGGGETPGERQGGYPRLHHSGGVAPQPPRFRGRHYPCGGVAPQPQQMDPGQVAQPSRDSIIGFIGKRIIGSDPGKRIESGFSGADVDETACKVAAFWVKTRQAERARVLANTYGLAWAKVEELVRATSEPLPLPDSGGAAPARPPLRCLRDPQNLDEASAAFIALSEIRMHGAMEQELRQSVGLDAGEEVTVEKLRTMVGKAKDLDYGDQVVAAAIFNLSLFIAKRDGRIVALLKEVRKDAGIPIVIADAIGNSLYLLEQSGADVEGK